MLLPLPARLGAYRPAAGFAPDFGRRQCERSRNLLPRAVAGFGLSVAAEPLEPGDLGLVRGAQGGATAANNSGSLAAGSNIGDDERQGSPEQTPTASATAASDSASQISGGRATAASDRASPITGGRPRAASDSVADASSRE